MTKLIIIALTLATLATGLTNTRDAGSFRVQTAAKKA